MLDDDADNQLTDEERRQRAKETNRKLRELCEKLAQRDAEWQEPALSSTINLRNVSLEQPIRQLTAAIDRLTQTLNRLLDSQNNHSSSHS